MGYQPLRGAATPAHFYPYQGESGLMAGVEAGIVAGADIYSQPSSSKWGTALGNPGVWSYLWVGIALLYLVGIYVGAIRIQGG